MFGGSRGKTRRSEIWFYFVRVPKISKVLLIRYFTSLRLGFV
ncbi:MAG: hypothetical protein ACI9G6_002759 [Limisphaerales bacterium]